MTRSLRLACVLLSVTALSCDESRPVTSDSGGAPDAAKVKEDAMLPDAGDSRVLPDLLDGMQPVPDAADVSCFAKHKDKSSCEKAAGCQWKHAGCGGPPKGYIAGFCYKPPLPSCAKGSCPPTHVCKKVWIDPCEGMTCTACGGTSMVCLPAN